MDLFYTLEVIEKGRAIDLFETDDLCTDLFINLKYFLIPLENMQLLLIIPLENMHLRAVIPLENMHDSGMIV